MTELGLLRKSSNFPAMICCADIGRPEVQRRIDPEKIDRRIFKSGARGERAAQNRRAGDDVGKSPADAHDFGRVRDPFEIAATRRFDVRVFRRDEQVVVARAKLRAQHDRAVAPESGIDETLGETLGLGLSANENGDAENDAAQAENKSALAMEKETQRDVERRRHSGFRRHELLTSRCLTS